MNEKARAGFSRATEAQFNRMLEVGLDFDSSPTFVIGSKHQLKLDALSLWIAFDYLEFNRLRCYNVFIYRLARLIAHVPPMRVKPLSVRLCERTVKCCVARVGRPRQAFAAHRCGSAPLTTPLLIVIATLFL